jgi:hypothetical protein
MAVRRRSEATKSQGQPQVSAAQPRPEHRVPERETAAATASVVVGRLLAGSTATAPLVDFAGNVNGPVRGRSAMPMDEAVVDCAVATRQGALLVFENGDPALPIVTGLIWSGQAATPFQQLLVAPRSPAAPAPATAEARLDGERVVLEGKREVVLKCGEASITLRSDGRLVLRGAYVESYSKGLNRIKGSSVKIN